MAIRILSGENITGSFEVSGKVGIGTAPTSRNLSVFRGTAGSVANFLHYTDASNFAGLYIGVSQSSETVSLNASGSTGGNFEMQCGNATVLSLNNTSATFAGFATFTGRVDSINGEGFRLKNAANSTNEGGFTRSGYWEGNTNRDPGIFAETGLNLRFYAGGSGTPKMILSSTGNVGIGTGTNIYGDLHLQGGQQDIVLTNTAADGVAGLTISRIIGQARGYSNNGAVMQSIDFETNSGFWYKGDIVFKTNNTDGTDTTVAASERMRIKADGSINIGSRRAALPSNFGYSGSYKVLILGSSGTNYQTDAVTLSLGVDVTGNPSGAYNGNGREIIIRNEGAFISPNAANNGYNTILSWNSSGQPYFNQNVGIGTTLPGEKLEVNGVIQIKRVGDHPAIRFVENTTTRGYIGTGDWAINGLSDADLGISSASAGSLVLGTNSGNGRVYIVNGGNVGINAATPRDKLTVFTAGSSEQEIGLRLVNPIGFTNAGSGASIIFAQDRSQTENLPMAKIRSSQTAAGSSCCGDLIFSTSHTSLGGMIDRMKITASGTVGIPNDVGSFSGAASLVLTKKSGVPYIQYQYSGTSTSFRLEMDEYVTSGNVRQYFTQTNAGVSNGFSMTFNTGSVIFGDLEVASATVNSGSAFKKDSKARMTLCQASNSTALTDLQEYFNPNGAVGKIQTSGSATLFTTSSDYRLKEDLKSFSGLEMVSKIPVYDFKWKISDERSYGVMAHELQEVLPQAVGGDKDYEKEHVVKKAEYDDDHNLIKDAEYGKRPSYQTVDYSKIVPLLVKSIQELKAEIELLKNK
jgi:hypothetical protein